MSYNGPLPQVVKAGGSGASTLTGVLTGNGTSAFTATAITQHDVLVGAASNAITSVSPSTSGFVLTSNGVASDPSFQTVSASGAITSITGNSGVAESPSSGNFNILGTGSITVAGSANTETVQLTGLTNHAVLIGAGTATITNVIATANTGAVLQNNSGADPSYSTATYPSTTTINQILYSSSANVIGGITSANNGVLITGTSGIPSILAAGTTGQVLTATTGSPPSWASPSSSGTVTSVSVVSANGFAGTVATATTTPAITISTTITGVLSGNGTAISGSAITQHDVLVGGASNAITSVGTGSAGQVLQSGGASADPSYSTATYPSTSGTSGNILTSNGTNWVSSANSGVGNLVLIQSQTASAVTNITFTSGINSTYNNYVLYFSKLIPSNGGYVLELQVSINGGSSYIATGYTSGATTNGFNTNAWGNANSTSFMYVANNALSTTAGHTASGVINLLDFTSNTFPKGLGHMIRDDALQILLAGDYAVVSTINAFKILASTGTFSGVFTLFGILE